MNKKLLLLLSGLATFSAGYAATGGAAGGAGDIATAVGTVDISLQEDLVLHPRNGNVDGVKDDYLGFVDRLDAWRAEAPAERNTVLTLAAASALVFCKPDASGATFTADGVIKFLRGAAETLLPGHTDPGLSTTQYVHMIDALMTALVVNHRQCVELQKDVREWTRAWQGKWLGFMTNGVPADNMRLELADADQVARFAVVAYACAKQIGQVANTYSMGNFWTGGFMWLNRVAVKLGALDIPVATLEKITADKDMLEEHFGRGAALPIYSLR